MPQLKHYGVLGMKWGVRRYQNYDGTRITKDTPTKIKKGTTFNRVTNTKNETSGKRSTYVTVKGSPTDKEYQFWTDKREIVDLLSADAAFAPDTFRAEYKAVKDLIGPSENERVDAIFNIYKNKEYKKEILSKRSFDQENKKELKNLLKNVDKSIKKGVDPDYLTKRNLMDALAGRLNQTEKAHQVYLDTFRNKKYDIIIDDAQDYSLTSRGAIKILDKNKSIKLVDVKPPYDEWRTALHKSLDSLNDPKTTQADVDKLFKKSNALQDKAVEDYKKRKKELGHAASYLAHFGVKGMEWGKITEDVGKFANRTRKKIEKTARRSASDIKSQVQNRASNIQKDISKTASSVQKDISKTASNVGKQVSTTKDQAIEAINKNVHYAREKIEKKAKEVRGDLSAQEESINAILGENPEMAAMIYGLSPEKQTAVWALIAIALGPVGLLTASILSTVLDTFFSEGPVPKEGVDKKEVADVVGERNAQTDTNPAEVAGRKWYSTNRSGEIIGVDDDDPDTVQFDSFDDMPKITDEEVANLNLANMVDIVKDTNDIEKALKPGLTLQDYYDYLDAVRNGKDIGNMKYPLVEAMDYYTNCQRSTVAYELRRRGYDVEAMPAPSMASRVTANENPDSIPGYNTLEEVAQNFKTKPQAYIFGTNDGSSKSMRNAAKISGYNVMSTTTLVNGSVGDKLISSISKTNPPGARGNVVIEGHIFNYEVDKNKKVYLVDAQTGVDEYKYISTNVVMHYRTDNLELNDQVLKQVRPRT